MTIVVDTRDKHSFQYVRDNGSTYRSADYDTAAERNQVAELHAVQGYAVELFLTTHAGGMDTVYFVRNADVGTVWKTSSENIKYVKINDTQVSCLHTYEGVVRQETVSIDRLTKVVGVNRWRKLS
jgi:hypothetical protein